MNETEQNMVTETVPYTEEPSKGKKPISKKKLIIIIVSVILVLGVIGGIAGGVVAIMTSAENYDFNLGEFIAGRTPTWEDNFDAATLNTDIWNVQCDKSVENAGNPSVRRGGYWSADQVTVENGNLVITTEQKADGYYYTGAVTTEKGGITEGYYGKYGYFETRCILPKGYGIWAAFWMMTDNFGNSKGLANDADVFGAEIDIMETPCYPQGKVQHAVHLGGYGSKHKSICNVDWIGDDFNQTLYDAYHTYGVYWNEEIYIFYVDGVARYSTSFNGKVSTQPEFLFLSVEIGGDASVKDANGGPVPGDNWGWPATKITDNKNGELPSRFVIDYVRHYALV